MSDARIRDGYEQSVATVVWLDPRRVVVQEGIYRNENTSTILHAADTLIFLWPGNEAIIKKYGNAAKHFQYTITQEVVTYMHTACISIHDQDQESKKINFISQPYTSHAAGWF